MPSNHGPTAFQSNAFQTQPLAFQIDQHTEEAPGAKSWIAQAPAVDGLIAEAAKVNIWVPEDEPNPTP